ncbi:MAG: hypothetical protein JW834_01855 [Candidatus Diapherotrites archaeon]|nr:hypothetical protein [Candidatus Diapherotrites archaeon]
MGKADVELMKECMSDALELVGENDLAAAATIASALYNSRRHDSSSR